MDAKYCTMTVELPASQLVRLENEAAAKKQSLTKTASFLLSKWVLTTQGRKVRKGVK